MIFIGIDPGLTGAVSFISQQGAFVEDLPVIEIEGSGMIKSKLAARALGDLIRARVAAGEAAMAVVEDVRTMPSMPGQGRPGNSPQSQGSLMHSKGVIEAVLEMLRIPTHLVGSQRWKAFYGYGKEKQEGMAIAARLYPELAEQRLTRKKDHNRAEAVLLAHYGRKVLG